MLDEDQLTIQNIDHLGIVAGLVDKLKLVERIDARLPILNQQQSHVSHGQRIKAMILNGLGFNAKSNLSHTEILYWKTYRAE